MRHCLRDCLLVLTLATAGCPPTRICTPNDTRCVDNSAEICSPDYEWLPFMNCEDVNLVCRETAAGHTCLPVGPDGLPPAPGEQR